MLLIGATPVIRKVLVGFNHQSAQSTPSRRYFPSISFQLPSSQNILVALKQLNHGFAWQRLDFSELLTPPPEADWRRGRLSVERQYMLEPESRTFQHSYVYI